MIRKGTKLYLIGNIEKPLKFWVELFNIPTTTLKSRLNKGMSLIEAICFVRQKEDLTNKKYNQLLVIEEAEPVISKAGATTRKWHCKCDCGNTTIVSHGHLKNGHTKSCGCLHKETMKAKLTTHGVRNTSTYRSWAAAKQRCTNPNNKRYKDYLGRGITMCPEWLNSFEAFYKDMGDCPEGMTLDRIDNNGNYEPSNCRWATDREQANNKRNNHLLTYQGRSQSIQKWSRETGINQGTICNRVNRLGWSDAEALTIAPIPGRARAA